MTGPVLLIGNPNSGKSTLFNALTGLHTKVANYPGITVEAKLGKITRLNGEQVDIIDLPGTYSLIPASEEEELSVKALMGDIQSLKDRSLIVMVIDATELRRGLYLYSQLIELGFKTIIALTMIDQKPELKKTQSLNVLKKSVCSYVVPVSSFDQKSITHLKTTIDGVLSGSLTPQIKKQPLLFKSLSQELIDKLAQSPKNLERFPQHIKNNPDLIRNHNIVLYRLAKCARLGRNEKDLSHLHLTAHNRSELDALLASIPEQRFQRIDTWIKDIKTGVNDIRRTSDRIDKFLLHPVLGSAFLLVLFVSLLQALFTIAQPLGDGLESGLGYMSNLINNLLPAGSMIQSLVIDGVFAGVSSILSFLPLIALLFFFLALLEDSGYLARATYLLDASLKKVGLCGRSLVPMLSSFACAVPAIMATRTIGNRKERLITIMVTPFLTCSARLPVFGLIVGALFSTYPPFFGFLNRGALIFLAMYALGIIASLFSAYVLSKIIKSSHKQGLSIELPPYRMPQLSSLIKRVVERIHLFVRDVGSVILASTILIWALFHFEPHHPPLPENSVAELSTTKVKFENSYAGLIGKTMEPLVTPMGLDWQVSIGILASFLAREVFVSTMAVVYGLQNEEDNNLKNAFKKNITPLSGFCLLVFFTLSMQCISTLATTHRETGSLVWTLLQFLLMTGSAYLLALLSYAIGNLF
ncbi:MAG: ferrous iron transport protein B [Myxococcales bacterium]|nr:ferrous iron transport protein B [Myxococcales bacterium]USN49975.1 MAG: ferrous iron transport protein B [Myxococcales bacterium]